MENTSKNNSQETADYLALNYSRAEIETARDVLLTIASTYHNSVGLTAGDVCAIICNARKQLKAAE